MNKHTPGPWVVERDSVGPRSQEDDQSFGMMMQVAYVERFDWPENADANARLIAASPTLLVELQETHAALCFTPNYIGSLRYERNKAAIELAGGEP